MLNTTEGLQQQRTLMARIGPGGAESRTLMEYFWDTVDNCVPPATIVRM